MHERVFLCSFLLSCLCSFNTQCSAENSIQRLRIVAVARHQYTRDQTYFCNTTLLPPCAPDNRILHNLTYLLPHHHTTHNPSPIPNRRSTASFARATNSGELCSAKSGRHLTCWKSPNAEACLALSRTAAICWSKLTPVWRDLLPTNDSSARACSCSTTRKPCCCSGQQGCPRKPCGC